MRLTAKIKEPMFLKNESGILITTYSMITHRGERSEESGKIFKQIQDIDWGLLILDEV